MTLSQAVDMFLVDREIRGCTDATVQYYKDMLWAFQLYAGETLDVQTIIPQYLYKLKQRDLAAYSIHAHYRAIRAFVRFTEENEWTPHIKLPKIKTPDKEIVPMSLSQVRRLLDHYRGDAFIQTRNRAIIATFYDTGIRLGELTKLDLPDVDYRAGFLFVNGKGNKDRYVPFSKKCRKFLWAYQKASVEKRGDEQPFFINRLGTRLQIDGLKQVFKSLSTQIEMPGIRISAHTLRHSFALSYLENRGDLQSLQKIMGHSSPEITLKYGRMVKGHMKQQHDRYSPGDRI